MSEGTKPPLIVVPEFIIHDAIEKALAFLVADYKAAVAAGDETKSFLYKLIGASLGFQKYKYFEQAKAVFVTADKENPRNLEVHLMFNMQRQGLPTIHITTPAETSGPNALGQDQGYEENIINYDEETPPVAQTTNNVFTRRYQATYDIVITSDNSNEVILIFHILKALLTSLVFHFHASGLQNISLSGQDLSPFLEVVPKSSFVRAVRMGLQYETSTTSFETQNIIASTIFTPTPIAN